MENKVRKKETVSDKSGKERVKMTNFNNDSLDSSIISFVELFEKPLMNISKNPGTNLRDLQEVDITVTNLETMKRFFVKVQVNAVCQRRESSHIQIRNRTKMELNFINDQKTNDFILRSIRKAQDEQHLSLRTVQNQNMSISWDGSQDFIHTDKFYRSKETHFL
jgi:hypothetical protein